MNKHFLFPLFIFACFLIGSSQAAEITVAPGVGTLQTAINAASAGDTLLLQNGTYSGATTINKGLTIRPVNLAIKATLAGAQLVINAPSSKVIIQNLSLTDGVRVDNGDDVQILKNNYVGSSVVSNVKIINFSKNTFLATLDINKADDVRIFENEFSGSASIDVNDRTSGALTIIGNRLGIGGNIQTIRSNDHESYIAGNTLSNGFLRVAASAWIVGNYINYDGQNPLYVDSLGTVQIIGNEIVSNVGHSSSAIAIAKAPVVLVAGNILKLNNCGTPYNSSDSYYNNSGLSSNNYTNAYNNVIVYKKSGTCPGNGIYAPSGKFRGNIIIGGQFPIKGTTEASYNLCYNNGYNTYCGTNYLAADPKFIDEIDYKLAAGSPAINAGSPDLALSDLDHSRNDMGVHGGPWDIAQYKAQRDPLYLGPFVYPLFDANASFLDADTLQVRALGVARLR
ncbi:hypothetical protein [Chromatium okenii]|uniref:hypothetical protein n=1 Tax=Chromatium okenii TaxID=61644 RepID=UPI0026EA8249|nr:hypothetical protein [Chromatium okenii]MBV5309319.1 hypothetical protein [Chromatium okenii]